MYQVRKQDAACASSLSITDGLCNLTFIQKMQNKYASNHLSFHFMQSLLLRTCTSISICV